MIINPEWSVQNEVLTSQKLRTFGYQRKLYKTKWPVPGKILVTQSDQLHLTVTETDTLPLLCICTPQFLVQVQYTSIASGLNEQFGKFKHTSISFSAESLWKFTVQLILAACTTGKFNLVNSGYNTANLE